MIIRTYSLEFHDDEAKVSIARDAEILSVGMRRDFALGKFHEVPFIVVKEDESKEREELCIRRIPTTEPVEVKTWQFYLGVINLDNNTSAYNLIAE